MWPSARASRQGLIEFTLGAVFFTAGVLILERVYLHYLIPCSFGLGIASFLRSCCVPHRSTTRVPVAAGACGRGDTIFRPHQSTLCRQLSRDRGYSRCRAHCCGCPIHCAIDSACR